MKEKKEEKKVKVLGHYGDEVIIVNNTGDEGIDFFDGCSGIVVNCDTFGLYTDKEGEPYYDVLLDYTYGDTDKKIIYVGQSNLAFRSSEECFCDECKCENYKEQCKKSIKEVANEVLEDDDKEYEEKLMAKTMLELLDKAEKYDNLE